MQACPTDDQLGAMIEHALGDAETERIATHLDSCAACQRVALAAVRAVAVSRPRGTPSGPYLAGGVPFGTTFGRFAVGRLLGAGGMGEVYEAYDAELDRSIALKVLRPEHARLADRLVRESRMMAKIVDPAVITVHDVGRDRDAIFIAMELVRGTTLGAHVAARQPSWREIVALYQRAGRGLAAAHAVGVVHRDFKPENVLVELGGDAVQRVVVTDFGISRAAAAPDSDADVQLTVPGVAVGTPAYMAPEQLAGHAVDARADVFAFSVSLWEALFGARPFAGATVGAIREAMTRPPRAPGGVPRRLVRALERGLAIDPEARWPSMAELVRELAEILARRRRVQIAVAALGLVAIGIVGSLALARATHRDPCAIGSELDAAYRDRRGVLASALASDPPSLAAVLVRFDHVDDIWRATHAATCSADRTPIQSATTTACLDARRIELAGIVDDLVHDGPRHAREYGGFLGDPALCAQPADGLLVPWVPRDPVLRRIVTPLRHQVFDAEAARDRQDFASATASARRLVAIASHVWPMLHAETVYLLGTTLSMSDSGAVAVPVLHEAVVVAAAAHDDYIEANGWIQLAESSSNDAGDAVRGLEYTTYANAAIDRLGRPRELVALNDYVRGSALVDLHRWAEAETALRESISIGESDPEASYTLATSIQGLGYLFEDEGRYRDAVAEYRRALARVPESDASASAIVFRERLAVDLASLGDPATAEPIARQAFALAQRTIGDSNIDAPIAQASLAEVLHVAGKDDEALAAIRDAVESIKRLAGGHGERYASALGNEADMLSDLARFAEAAPLYARACDILAAQTGDASSEYATCQVGQAHAYSVLGRGVEALALIRLAVPVEEHAYTRPHPGLALALYTRGAIERRLGQRTAAIADLEDAIDQLEHVQIDPGQVASVQLELAKAVGSADPARARSLIATAIARFEKAPPLWASELGEARALEKRR
jgi:tetratricopeptide (TPR) repeat protein